MGLHSGDVRHRTSADRSHNKRQPAAEFKGRNSRGNAATVRDGVASRRGWTGSDRPERTRTTDTFRRSGRQFRRGAGRGGPSIRPRGSPGSHRRPGSDRGPMRAEGAPRHAITADPSRQDRAQGFARPGSDKDGKARGAFPRGSAVPAAWTGFRASRKLTGPCPACVGPGCRPCGQPRLPPLQRRNGRGNARHDGDFAGRTARNRTTHDA